MIIKEKATEKQMKTEKRQNILPCMVKHPPYFRRPHASRHVILHFAFSAWWDRALKSRRLFSLRNFSTF